GYPRLEASTAGHLTVRTGELHAVAQPRRNDAGDRPTRRNHRSALPQRSMGAALGPWHARHAARGGGRERILARWRTAGRWPSHGIDRVVEDGGSYARALVQGRSDT